MVIVWTSFSILQEKSAFDRLVANHKITMQQRFFLLVFNAINKKTITVISKLFIYIIFLILTKKQVWKTGFKTHETLEYNVNLIIFMNLGKFLFWWPCIILHLTY